TAFHTLSLHDALPIFDRFYDEGFLKLKEAAVDVPAMRESVKILKEKGYNLVIATNPVFPLKSILHRIRWAGFEPEQFSYISCYRSEEHTSELQSRENL